ncbi:MAG: hypothetical protein ABJE95_30055 [Byssovorax sp.]
MASRRTAFEWLFWLAPALLSGCNAIFGIEPASSGSVGSTGAMGGAAATTASSSSSGGIGGATATGAGGAASSTSTSGTGGAAPCPPDRVQACDPVGGACTPHLVDGALNDAIRIAVSGDFVFISTDIGIHRERYDGTQGLDFGAINGGTDGLTIAGDHLYWANYYNGVVTSAKLDGNGMLPVAKLPMGDTIGDGRIAVRNGYVYWTSYTPHAIWRAKADGSEQQTPLKVVSDDDPVLKVSAPRSVVVDDTHLYWTDDDGVHRMLVADIGTPAAKILDFAIDPSAPPLEMILDEARVYWLSPFGDVRSKLTSAQPNDTSLVYQTQQPDAPVQLAVDETYLYWIAESGAVSRVKKGGGAVDLVVAGVSPAPMNAPPGLAVDCGAIYWTSTLQTMGDTGKLWKAAKGP